MSENKRKFKTGIVINEISQDTVAWHLTYLRHFH